MKRICPNCRKTLPPDVPLGLCPECLIKSGFNTGTEPANPGKESGFVPPPVEELRRLFPQLEILELIGKGGMGAVYKARQLALDRLVALKILPPGAADDAGFAERFTREARALARLNHPHIVAVHDFGQAGGQPYLVMEFVDGPNLRQVEQAGRLTPEQALEVVPQICEALQFAHNEGVVHRDIKPENILLDKKGRVKITDFGIAKIVGVPAGKVSLTGAKDVLGTPHYMAPEQVEKPTTVDHRADIYSLGVVFYEMLTGELPLGKFQPPSRKVQVDVRLDEVVLHALEKEPESRYQHASQVKTDLETIATSVAKSESEARPEVHWVVPGAVAAVIFYAALVAGATLIYALPFGGRLNLALAAVLVAALPIMVVFVQRWVRRTSADGRVAWLRAWAWMGWLLAVPVVGFGLLFLHAFLASTSGWNPAPGEAVIVPLTWLGSLALPAAGLALLRAGGVSKRLLWWMGLASVLVAAAAMAGLYASDVYHHRAAKEQLARAQSELQQVQQQQAKAGAPGFPEPGSIPQEAFSRVVERVVAGEGEANQRFIDFDSGQLFVVTEFFEAKALRMTLIDALGDTSPAVRGLVGFEMMVASVPVEEWENATPARLEHYFTLAQPGTPATMSGRGKLPATFAFKTREGGRGLLQITGITGIPRGVKIRYKLMKAATNETAPSLLRAGSLPTSLAEPAEYHVTLTNEQQVETKPTATNAVVAAPVTPNPQEAVTRARLRQLSSAIDTFEVDCGAYPGSLDVLVRNPGGLNWKGPYFPANSWPPKDAWATPFQIEVGDQPRNRKPSILSAGPDKQFGTADDLVEKVINPATFGPVMESVLKAPQVRPEGRVAELLDLDTGRRGTSANFGDNDRETHAWLRTNQLDVIGVIEQGQIAVLCFDMVVLPAVTNDWETVSAQNLTTNGNLTQSEPNKITAISPMTDNTDTWLFRTREGGHGILQVLGQSSDPLGVKIRYKLVQTADSGAISPPSTAPARRVIAQAPFSAKLAEGEVELVALSYYPSTHEPWWAPDGGAAKEGPFVTEASGDSSADFRMFAIVARLREVPTNASQPAWKTEPRNSWAQGKALLPNQGAGEGLVMISCKQPRSAVTANVRIGIASGAWETVARARAGAVDPGAQPGPKGSAMFLPLADMEGGVRVSVTHDYRDMDLRLIAVESDGSSRGGTNLDQSLSEAIGHTTMTFPGLSRNEAVRRGVEVHFQVRPYRWVEFHNVSLKPGQRTQVKVRDATRN